MAAAKYTELPAVVVPPHLWLRSPRPTPGKILQVVLPGILLLAGVLMSSSRMAVRISLVLAGLGLYLLLPALVLGRLEKMGREIQAADRKTAAELLRTLRTRPLVQFFAPHAWLTLHEGILALKTGDGRVAAKNFAETARLVRQPDAVMLISAQAHAMVLAGDRAEARDLLQRLAKENLASPRDLLDLGIVMLLDSKKHKQAQAYVETARKTLGDHPRVLAAMALAMQKAERIDEASEMLEQVQVMITAKGADVDPLLDDLTKRVRKALQAYIEAQLRKERRSRSRRTTIVVSSDSAASEIVSGEIGSGAVDTTQLDNPTTGFKPAEPAPSIISSKSVDEELTTAERKMLNIPESRPRKGDKPDPTASGPFFSIEEESSSHKSPEPEPTPAKDATPAKDEPAKDAPAKDAPVKDAPVKDAAAAEDGRVHPVPEVPSGPLVDSLLTALFDEPEKPTMPAPKAEPTGLINLTVPTAATTTNVTPPVAPLPPPDKPMEADVPVFRRRQTLSAIPVASEKPSSTATQAPTKPPAAAQLPVGGGPKSGLPTRQTRHEGNPVPGTVGAPRTTTPVFRAPNLGNKNGDDEPKR